MAANYKVLAVIAIFAQVGTASILEVAQQIDEPTPAEGFKEDHLLKFFHLLRGTLKDAGVGSRAIADKVSACFDDMENQSLQAGRRMETYFYALLDKVTDGRKLITDCNKTNPSDQQFAQCFGTQAETIQEDALLSLVALIEALQQGSDGIAAYVSQGIDCISSSLQSAIPH